MPAPHAPHDELGLPILIVRVGSVDSVDEVLRPGDGPVFIGRELPAQLRIDDPRISRTHARIESAGGHWVVFDEASTNGVFLDGTKVSTVFATDGMTLHLGHPEGIAVRFSFIDPDAGTMMATHAIPSRADDAGDARGEPDIARAGAAVAARREELGYSPRQLSDDGVISRDELEDFERGRRWPAESTRVRVEHALRWSPGTITSVAHGGEVPEDDDTETLSDSVQLEVMLDYARITLNGLVARIATLPPAGDPDFVTQVADHLAQLRRLLATTAHAARTARTLEIMLALSDVRRTFSDLMLAAAAAPSATLGQRLYAARHRAQLSAVEIAAATGVDVDAIAAMEADRSVSAEVSDALESVVLRLTSR
jgi:pSer/pThr/pTyr-binding forkhead associated (FHA) protein